MTREWTWWQYVAFAAIFVPVAAWFVYVRIKADEEGQAAKQRWLSLHDAASPIEKQCIETEHAQ